MFNIKHYTKNKTPIQTLNIEEMINISSFSSESNWGLGQLTIQLNFSIIETIFKVWDLIEVYFKWQHIYWWSIIDVKKIYWTNIESISIILVWYASLLSKLIINHSYNMTWSEIIKDIIDQFNIEYWYDLLSYTSESIEDTIWDINITFTYKTYLEALINIAEISWIDFFINQNWVVFFRSTLDLHKLTLKSDVNELEVTEEWRSLINYLILNYTGWTEVYPNNTSIAEYGKKEQYLNKTDIWNLTTANKFWESFLNENSNIIKKVSLIVNNKYNYFNIKSGDLVTVKNSNYTIENLQIKKVNFSYEQAEIELSKSYSFANEIFSNN